MFLSPNSDLFADFQHLGEACTAHNLCCAIINYRLSPLTVPEDSEDHFKHPGHVQDCAAALSYLYSNSTAYSYDVHNVIIIGHSAGAFMAAELQFDEKLRSLWSRTDFGLRVRHYVGLQGIYDLCSILSDFGKDYLTYMIAPAFGWSSEKHKEVSPTTRVKQLSQNTNAAQSVDYAPWTLIWSDQDTMVNRRQSEEFEAVLLSAGVPVSHIVLLTNDAEGGSHHGVTTSNGFSQYILPELLKIADSLKENSSK